MPLDPWGLPKFYPPKKGGFEWYQSNDILNDIYFNDQGHVSSSSGGIWVMETSGPDSVQFAKNSTTATVIGGCDMNFDATAARGYAYKADDPRDVEIKFLIKFEESGSDNGFAVEVSSGNHSGSSCCSGFSYKLDIQYRKSPTIFRFRKEMYHSTNSDDPVTGQFTSSLSPSQLLGSGNYVGVGLCRYNKTGGANSGHNTDDSVILEFWFNPNPISNPTAWTMVKRTEDKGGWGTGGDQCNGDNDQIGSWAVQKYRLKSNDSSGTFRFQHLSFREIDPNGTFEDTTPENPPDEEAPGQTTELLGSFKVQWDINDYSTQSSCAGAGGGGGGGSGATKFYTVYTDQGTDTDKELSDSSTFLNRKRIVMSPANSSSVFTGKKPVQLDIPLKKVGSPATNNINAKIWDSAGNVVYTSPTNIADSSLTTSYVLKTFDFASNTRTLVTGDRIGVEYLGTSSSNYVVASYNPDSYSNTNYYQYEGTTWKSVGRRLIMDVWQ